MQVSALQCPGCFAPVLPAGGNMTTCRYCGMAIAIHGVAPVAAPPPATGSVFLEHAGSNVIAVIKVVRENTGLGLRESKELVDKAPCPVGQGLDPQRVARLRDELVKAGARVR